MVYVPIADYRPDVSEMNGETTDTLINVLPADGSYIPVPGVIFFSDNVPEPVLSSYCVRYDNKVRIFVGCSKNIYTYDIDKRKWKSVSKTGTTYSADENDRWNFTLFGSYLIAVNINDAPQYFDLKTGTNFQDLGGNPPKASFAKVWGDFLCLLRLENHPTRVHWSGLNDINHWTVGEKNCDYQDFPDGEILQGSTEATNPIIFLRSAIYAGIFVPGSSLVFQFNKIQDKRGSKSVSSIACRGQYAFFLDDSGFYQIDYNGTIVPIGFEKVDRTLIMKFDNNAIGDINGVVDPIYNRVYWSMRVSNNKQFTLVYDWRLQKWSTLYTDRLLLFPCFTIGYRLDELDQFSTDLESFDISFDSRFWQSGAPILACFDEYGRLGFFCGPNLEATLISQEMSNSNGDVVFLEKIAVDVDSWDGLVSVGKRMLRSDLSPITWSMERSSSDYTGLYHGRSRGRYHRFKIRIPQGTKWTHITGFDVNIIPSGKR